MLWMTHNLLLLHHLWLKNYLCCVVIFSYYPTPLNFVCVLALGFQVFTTCAQLQNLIWMIIRSTFSPRLSWIALKHIFTLFIVLYMIQWAVREKFWGIILIFVVFYAHPHHIPKNVFYKIYY